MWHLSVPQAPPRRLDTPADLGAVMAFNASEGTVLSMNFTAATAAVAAVSRVSVGAAPPAVAALGVEEDR